MLPPFWVHTWFPEAFLLFVPLLPFPWTTSTDWMLSEEMAYHPSLFTLYHGLYWMQSHLGPKASFCQKADAGVGNTGIKVTSSRPHTLQQGESDLGPVFSPPVGISWKGCAWGRVRWLLNFYWAWQRGVCLYLVQWIGRNSNSINTTTAGGERSLAGA